MKSFSRFGHGAFLLCVESIYKVNYARHLITSLFKVHMFVDFSRTAAALM